MRDTPAVSPHNLDFRFLPPDEGHLVRVLTAMARMLLADDPNAAAEPPDAEPPPEPDRPPFGRAQSSASTARERGGG